MQEILTPGYAALFLVSFLAATVIPLGSEWLLTGMLIQDFAPLPVVAVATAGNYLGSCTTYWVGLYGGPFLIRRVLRIGPDSQERAAGYFRKYGSWTLLFAWLPIIGDPLCLAAGLFRIRFDLFTVLVVLGKLGRYAGLAGLVVGARP